MSQNLPQKSQFLIYQAENGQMKIEVRLENETVWLTQRLMAELFQTSQQNISQHILSVFKEGELLPEATHKKILSVRREGEREVQRQLDYYNLDMIITPAIKQFAYRPPKNRYAFGAQGTARPTQACFAWVGRSA